MRVVVALLVGLLLAGCASVVDGTASPGAVTAAATPAPTGPAVIVDAAEALEKVGAVHISGTMTLDPLNGDLAVQEQLSAVDVYLQGRDLIGKRAFDGQVVEMIRTGGVLYERAAAAFWAEIGYSAGTAGRLAGAWVQVPVDPQATGYWDLSLAAVIDKLRFDAGGYDAGVSKETWEGKDAWLLAGPGGPTQVAADGQPYPLHVSGIGAEPGDLTFTDFGVAQTITAPTESVQLPPR